MQIKIFLFPVVYSYLQADGWKRLNSTIKRAQFACKFRFFYSQWSNLPPHKISKYCTESLQYLMKVLILFQKLQNIFRDNFLLTCKLNLYIYFFFISPILICIPFSLWPAVWTKVSQSQNSEINIKYRVQKVEQWQKIKNIIVLETI